MNEFQVTCINKRDRMSSHEHISHIGNITNPPPNRWRLTREEAIRRIDAKTESFYTIDRSTGVKVYVYVVRELGKLPYLRTYADGKWNDNLLALSECDNTCTIIS
jgi:Protein of unknown function (DUF3892)